MSVLSRLRNLVTPELSELSCKSFTPKRDPPPKKSYNMVSKKGIQKESNIDMTFGLE